VGVLVERTSRLVLVAKMDDATAASALAGFSVKLNSIAAPMRHSLTYDQGKEMARHTELAARTGVKVYFCDPHSPWQRGTCENTNGLLRQYLPKGTDTCRCTLRTNSTPSPTASTADLAPPMRFARRCRSSHKCSSSLINPQLGFIDQRVALGT
jgi:hypothetical protein